MHFLFAQPAPRDISVPADYSDALAEIFIEGLGYFELGLAGSF
jgi:hypothetical protein